MPKILRSEREHIGLIINLVLKANIFHFFGTLVKNESKQTLLKKRWFDITSSGGQGGVREVRTKTIYSGLQVRHLQM